MVLSRGSYNSKDIIRMASINKSVSVQRIPIVHSPSKLNRAEVQANTESYNEIIKEIKSLVVHDSLFLNNKLRKLKEQVQGKKKMLTNQSSLEKNRSKSQPNFKQIQQKLGFYGESPINNSDTNNFADEYKEIGHLKKLHFAQQISNQNYFNRRRRISLNYQ